MAKESDDGYKEGVDFEWVQGNNDENSGFKTRRFFTRAEKEARKNPKPAAPKAAAPKAKLKGITTPKITTKEIDPAVRPTGKPAGMPESLAHETMRKLGTTKFGIQNYDKNLAEAQARRDKTKGMAGGGVVKMKEGSAKDMREDKAMAKKAGMTMKQHEASAADKKHDAPKKMAMGGKLKMVEKGGKKVPSFAADGVGKMAMGGAVKKMNYGGGMKTGGTVRGAGAAIRGKRFTGSC